LDFAGGAHGMKKRGKYPPVKGNVPVVHLAHINLNRERILKGTG